MIIQKKNTKESRGERIKRWQFTHKATKASEGSRDAGLWVDFY